MTSTYDYGKLKRNRCNNHTWLNSVDNPEKELRDYSKIEVHGYIQEKAKAPPEHDYFIWGIVIFVIILWIIFFL